MSKNSFSKIRQRIANIENIIIQLEREILDYLSRRKLIRGCLSYKYKRCNKKGCKCMVGQKHGPFLYLADKIDGKSKLIFIKKELEQKVAEYARNYQRWRQIRAKIVKLQKEIIQLLDKMEKGATICISDVKANGNKKDKH